VSIDHLLNQSNQVARATRVSNSQGGWALRYAIIADAVPMRIRPLSAPERVVGEREEAYATHRIYTRSDAGIERSDRIGVPSVVTSGASAVKTDSDTMGILTGTIASIAVGDWFYFDADGVFKAGVVSAVNTGSLTIDLEQSYAGSATSGAYTVIRHSPLYDVVFPAEPSQLGHHLEIAVTERHAGV
jgi:hypothetical protein